MKVFIAGASGVLGRRLTAQLIARGHCVIGQVRSANAENAVRAAGGEPRHADLFDAESLARAADGCDTVIHAATAIPSKTKTVPADWAMNDHIRRKGTRCLTEATAKIGAKAYLQQSVVWVARPTGQSVRDQAAKDQSVKDQAVFDEDSPTVPSPIMQSAIDGEEIAREAGSAEGFVTAVLRGGSFYDCDSARTRMFRDALLKRALPVIGRGDAVWAMIHSDDAASAFVTVAEQPRNGVWHVVDNELVSVRTFLMTLASRIGAPPPRRVPVWLAKWRAGEQAVAYLTTSTRTTNARFRRDFGWAPHYPTYREGLDQIAAAWSAGAAHNTAPSASER